MMTRRVEFFWGTAVTAAIGFAILSFFLLPYEALRITTDAERHRAWLLTLWTGGVFGILFGTSALLGAFRGIGFRDAYEAGGREQAAERHRNVVKPWAREPFHSSFAWWIITTGFFLVGLYFAAWILS
jgi:hypothetical protein